MSPASGTPLRSVTSRKPTSTTEAEHAGRSRRRIDRAHDVRRRRDGLRPSQSGRRRRGHRGNRLTVLRERSCPTSGLGVRHDRRHRTEHDDHDGTVQHWFEWRDRCSQYGQHQSRAMGSPGLRSWCSARCALPESDLRNTDGSAQGCIPWSSSRGDIDHRLGLTRQRRCWWARAALET